MNAAVQALGSQILKRPKTKQEQALEFEAKECAIIQREAEENNPSKANHLSLPDADSIEGKRQADAQKTIDRVISKFSVNGQTPGTIDDKKSEAGKAALRAIRILRGGKYDVYLTLKVVQSAFHYETVSEIKAAVQRELDKITNKGESERRKAEERLQGAGSGHLPRYY